MENDEEITENLTPRQILFCKEYLSNFNYIEAFVKSGYKMKLLPGSKYFVYLLVDPRNEQIFYIGKGTKKRPYDHIKESYKIKTLNNFKSNRITEILNSQYDVNIIYFETELDESEAFKIERLLISTIGTKNLTNISGGVRKESVKEWAKRNLKNMMPFDTWVEKRNIVSDLEKELYHLAKAAYIDISENGVLVSIEQKCIKGKVSTKLTYRK